MMKSCNQKPKLKNSGQSCSDGHFLSFINAGSLRVFKGFMLWLRAGCQNRGVSNLLSGVLPFTPNLLLIYERTDAFPDPSPDTTESLPPHTEEGREDRGGQKRRGEREVGSETDGTNQKQMLVHVWFSNSKRSRDTANCPRSPTISPFISSSHTQG